MLGDILGNYRVLRKLGEGGMGAVFLAEHTLIRSKAAVKVLLPEFLQQKDIADRFINEARVTSEIHHPGIVQIYDCGWHKDGSAYLVMEYLRGEPLDRRLRRRRRLPVGQALRIAHHCASALAAAHAAGVVHRDLKPGNIFLVIDPQVEGGERAKILDFGIAKLVDDRLPSPVKTRTGSMVGTPVYMSPEQCRGEGEVDHRSDIYALGCLLFRMICGRPPFVARGVGEIIASHLREPPPSPRQFVPGIPVEVEEVILMALAKSPDERFVTMAEMADTLRALSQLHPLETDEDEAVPATLGIAEGAGLGLVGGAHGEPEEPEIQIETHSASGNAGPLGSSPALGSSPGDPAIDGWAAPASASTRPLLRSHPHASSPHGHRHGAADPVVDEELFEGAPELHETTLGGVASQKLRLSRRSRKRSLVLALAGAALLGAVTLAVVKTWPAEPDEPRQPARRDRVAAPVPAPTAGEAAGAEDATDPADAPAMVRIWIETRPPGATVYLGDQKLGETPYEHHAARQPGLVTLTLHRHGYHTMSISFPGDRSDTISTALVPERRPASRRDRAGPRQHDERLLR